MAGKKNKKNRKVSKASKNAIVVDDNRTELEKEADAKAGHGKLVFDEHTNARPMEQNVEKLVKRQNVIIKMFEDKNNPDSNEINPKKIYLVLSIGMGIFIAAFVVFFVMFFQKRKDYRDSQRVINVLNSQIAQELENEKALQNNITELDSQVKILSETLAESKEQIDLLNADVSGSRLPKAYPIKGLSEMVSSDEKNSQDNPEGGNLEEGNEQDDTAVANPDDVDTDSEELYVDFIVSEGASASATGTGTVLSVDEDAEYGVCIKIDHGNGYISVYKGQGAVLVSPGDMVSAGCVIMKIVGENTIFKYQILLNDEFIDPIQIMEING